MPTNVYTGLPEETAAQRAALKTQLRPWVWAIAIVVLVTVATFIVEGLANG